MKKIKNLEILNKIDGINRRDKTWSVLIALTAQAQTLPDMQACPEQSRRSAGQVRELREAASLLPTLAGLLVSFAANDGKWRVVA